MIELTQHISKILLESDLAIVPGFGGFIAHYKPAVRDAENNLFIPPALTIGFNDQLTLNDGLLLQSYMATYQLNKLEAERKMAKDTEALRRELEENGCVELEGIGTLFCNASNKYSFKAEENVLDCPFFYGLDSFEMLEVAELIAEVSHEDIHVGEEALAEKVAPTSYIPAAQPSYSYFGAVAVIALAVVSLFMFSSPIENTEVVDVNYAKIVPTELWAQFSQKSITTTPIHLQQELAVSELEEPVNDSMTKSVSSKSDISYSRLTPSFEQVLNEEDYISEETVSEPVLSTKPYHIIVASAVQESHAKHLVDRLQQSGYEEAQVLSGEGPTRVSIACFTTSDEAYQALKELALHQEYESAWIYKLK